MSRERYKNKKWTHHTKRSNASIFVLRDGKGVGGWARRLSSTATAAAFPIRKAFHHFRRAWKTDAYQLIAYGVIANLRESE